MRGQEIEQLYSRSNLRLVPLAASSFSDHYDLLWHEGLCALGMNAENYCAALVVSVSEVHSNVGRTTVGLQLRQVSSASFDFMERRWCSPAVIVECRDGSFTSTFAAFASEVIATLGDKSSISARDILALFEQWEQLFSGVSRLDASEELGLWGELWLISKSRKIDDAVSAWIGHRNSRADFLASGVALEVKAGSVRLRHQISLDQVDEPVGDQPAYLVSLWCEQDEVAGVSLPFLVDQISSACEYSSAFERKLLGWGFSRYDAAAYTAKFLVLERPYLFPSEAVPRVRQFDRGVSRIRYTTTLDESRMTPLPGAIQILDHTLGIDPAATLWRTARNGADMIQ
jgi:Putative  PD-(D/E)XK family member, (DUF4420)